MPQKLITIKLSGRSWETLIVLDRYANEGPAIQLVDRESGELVTTATRWLEDLAPDEVAIKDYSENQGLYAQLLAARIIYPHHRLQRSGFVNFPICHLHQDFLSGE